MKSSAAIDHTSTLSSLPADNFDLRDERGRADFDQHHRFNVASFPCGWHPNWTCYPFPLQTPPRGPGSPSDNREKFRDLCIFGQEGVSTILPCSFAIGFPVQDR